MGLYLVRPSHQAPDSSARLMKQRQYRSKYLGLWRLLIVLPIALGLLTACEEPKTDLKSFVKKVKTKPVKPPKALPEPFIYEPVPYMRTDSRSPFRPVELVAAEIQREQKVSKIQPDLSREKDELEAYALSELTLVGILDQAAGRSALVSTPDGQVVIVKQGSYMGRNYGLVKSVSESEITLREIVKDDEGLWDERETEFSFQQGG